MTQLSTQSTLLKHLLYASYLSMLNVKVTNVHEI